MPWGIREFRPGSSWIFDVKYRRKDRQTVEKQESFIQSTTRKSRLRAGRAGDKAPHLKSRSSIYR